MRWSYKTVHFGLKKDGLLGSGFLDETEIEISLNEYGHAGWELVSFMEASDGLIAVFKQPLSRLSVSPGEEASREETDMRTDRSEKAESSSPLSQAAAPEEGQESDTVQETEEGPEMGDTNGAGAIRII